jgi:acetoin:2,6-dichlorophenolindophenol oxidoreductase subunit beta
MTTTSSRLNMSRVIAQTLDEAMAADPRILVIGEDVGKMGGVFGATRGLQRKHGADRVLDAPISEQSFVGLAVGAAQAGLRPVVEVMFVDFIGVCLDQVYNQMAKNHYMSNGSVRVPLVLRTAVGSIGDAAQHSQVLSGTFAHLPGLKLAFPSCPGDARGLLISALETDDPVVFFEHKQLLLAQLEDLALVGDVTTAGIPFGQASIVRPGSDLTIVASGWMVQKSLQAADVLEVEGLRAEVVDIRTVVPLDRQTILESALRTGTLLVVDEDYLSFGVSSEIVASVAEAAQDRGRIRFARHALPDVPIPASRPLEEAVLPSETSIAAAARDLLHA